MQVTYVQLFSLGENTGTSVYQWELQTHQKFPIEMNYLFLGFEFICAYIDDMLILTNGDWIDHVQKLELTLNKLKGKGLKCNI